jgi:hypothetical protein
MQVQKIVVNACYGGVYTNFACVLRTKVLLQRNGGAGECHGAVRLTGPMDRVPHDQRQ